MTNPFNNLKAPKRSVQEIDDTFKQIENKIAKNKKRTMWQNSGILVAIAAILLFFIASTTFPFSNQTASGTSEIQSIHYTDNIITDNFGPIEKWYYIDKVKLRGEQFDLAVQFVNRVDKGEKLPGSTSSNPQSYALIVKFNDGTVRKYQAKIIATNPDVSSLVLVNLATSQFAEFTPEEYSSLYFNEPDGLPNYVKMILNIAAIFIYISYLLLAQKLSPHTRNHYDRTSKVFLKIVGLWVFIAVVQYLSLAFFPGINLLFTSAVIAVVFICRLLKDYYIGQFKRNILEVPLSIAFYIVIFILLSVQ